MQTMMAEEIWQLMNNKLIRIGLSEGDARAISDCLTQTSLRGTDTHGIRLFDTYVREFEHGRANKQPNMVFERNTPVSSVLDGDNANGIIAGRYAMQQAIDKAKAIGLALVVVKNSNHFAAAANFTRLAAEQQCIGLCMSNSDALVALQGGVKPFLGTNPIAFSVPGTPQGFDLDFATSQVAYSKVMAYLATGQDLPAGWAIDGQGQDSSLASSGESSVQALKSLGGYKGQGLGLMVQMLTCVLSGMPFDHQLSHLYGEPYDTPRQVAHCFLAINPEIFMDFDVFTQRVSNLLAQARQHSPGAILPGDQEVVAQLQREKSGIPLSDKEWQLFELLREDEVKTVSA